MPRTVAPAIDGGRDAFPSHKPVETHGFKHAFYNFSVITRRLSPALLTNENPARSNMYRWPMWR